MYLRELHQSVTELPGVGSALASSYASLGITSWSDLLLHFPRAYEDRTQYIPLVHDNINEPVNTIVRVISQSFIGFGRKKTLKVTVADESGSASLVCFGRNFLQNMLKEGQTFYLYGNFSLRYNELQSTSFEVEPYNEGVKPKSFQTILPIYALSGKLTQNTLRRDITGLIDSTVRYIQNEVDDTLIARHDLLSKLEALREIHFPTDMAHRESARRSLAYEELLYLQLIVRRRALRRQDSDQPGVHRREKISGELAQKLTADLPFTLTIDQVKVLKEIRGDMLSPQPMARLIQGDVGSGKTLTAFISAMDAIERGGQCAFMAPTELLARQHAENAARLLEPLGVRLAYLTGSVPKSRRQHILTALKAGEIDLIIGTHALFSKDVAFRNLAFVIVDEQHRFGVLQRLALMQKGRLPDLLLMTATPIPRTLALTVFGDLDVSTIRTMPPGRKPIVTRLAAERSRERMFDSIRVEFNRGHQAYFVYPRIEDTGKSNLRDAESMYEYLTTQIYPGVPAGLIHSRIPEDKKLEIMDAFREGKITYLVSTSVVEVGVDVPNATCMVIEHAERFGLSALHQLRGRVGRGEFQSYLFLVYSDELNPEGKERLMIMKSTNDGFVIAEKDLQIRGPGEVAGIRQSGFLRLTAADLILDHDILTTARTDAENILEDDPGLLAARNQVYREVLQRCPPFDEELTEG